MNEKINAEEFRQSLDRSLSALKADPSLAQRIMNMEKGRERVKKKLSFGLACALAAVLMAAIAYAVTGQYRVASWQGEIKETEALEQLTEAYDLQGRQQMEESLRAFMDDVRDEETAFAWYENDDHEIQSSELHKTKKTFPDPASLEQYMAGISHLTFPSWFPDENKTYFDAEVYMSCKAFGTYTLLNRGSAGAMQYKRFLVDEDSTIPTGYRLACTMEDGCIFSISSELRTAPVSDNALMIREGETAEPVSIDGITDALLIRATDPAYPDGLIMHRILQEPIRWKQLPLNDYLEEVDDCYYGEELIYVWAYNIKDPEILLKLFSGE